MSIVDLFIAFQYAFVRNMFIAGLLASIACGIIGTYVVVKRLVFISGGLAHTCFGGVGLGYLLGFEPMLGAILFAIVAALIVAVTSLKTRIREDSTIGVLWVMGMALGVIFLKYAPGYVPDPMSILFGNILLVKSEDLWLMSGLIIVILLTVALLYKQMLAMTFDEEFAKIQGVPTEKLYIILLLLIALTVVTLIKVVGVVLIIALLTVPATISGLFTHKMKRMMALAVLIGIVFTTAGTLISWQYDIPTGATIVLLLGTTLITTMISKRVFSGLGPKSSVIRS